MSCAASDGDLKRRRRDHEREARWMERRERGDGAQAFAGGAERLAFGRDALLHVEAALLVGVVRPHTAHGVGIISWVRRDEDDERHDECAEQDGGRLLRCGNAVAEKFSREEQQQRRAEEADDDGIHLRANGEGEAQAAAAAQQCAGQVGVRGVPPDAAFDERELQHREQRERDGEDVHADFRVGGDDCRVQRERRRREERRERFCVERGEREEERGGQHSEQQHDDAGGGDECGRVFKLALRDGAFTDVGRHAVEHGLALGVVAGVAPSVGAVFGDDVEDAEPVGIRDAQAGEPQARADDVFAEHGIFAGGEQLPIGMRPVAVFKREVKIVGLADPINFVLVERFGAVVVAAEEWNGAQDQDRGDE